MQFLSALQSLFKTKTQFPKRIGAWAHSARRFQPAKRRLPCAAGIAFALMILAGQGSFVRATEPVIEFTEGLRNRNYFDTALMYLDQMAADPSVSPEIKALIPYEKAVTLKEGIKVIRTPELKSQQLDQAIAELESFVQKSPDHPLAAQANTQRALIILEKAKTEIWQGQSPSNQNKKAEFQARSRGLVKQARDIFQTAFNQHEANFKAFPVYIDENGNQEDRKNFEDRREAEVRYIIAMIDLATCTYEEAQTYDRENPEFKTLLTTASKEFEDIHAKFRSMVAGLHARMMQGKCFEEQDEIGKALGIYNEILGHPGTSASLRTLQKQVLHFKLICLNHEQRKDYQLVIDMATEWILSPANKRELRSTHGLGIRWELMRALESLADDRTTPEDVKERLYRQALTHANYINRFPGQYKDLSTFMISKLRGKLGRGEKDPEDFETAYGIAFSDIKKVKPFQDDIKAATAEGKPPEEIDQLKQDLQAFLSETSRMLELALRLADKDAEIEKVHHARYLLSYVYFLSHKSYEAAVLSEYVSRLSLNSQTSIGLDAAFLSLMAFNQAYRDSPKEFRDTDLILIQKACEHLTKNWPQSDSANDARMILGDIYKQLSQPVEAAKWYGEVPSTAPKYAEAQLAAGQAFWNGFLTSVIAPVDQRPSAETITEWQTQAEAHLLNGINQTKGTLAETANAPDEYIGAKITLSQVWLNKGQYKEAIDLLTVEPHSVMKAIAVTDENQRPKSGIQSAEIASLAYQLLLRGYVGTQQIDLARQTMTQLETVGGKGEHVTEIYKQLGQKIEEELKTLKASGNIERFTSVRTSLEAFLNDLSARPDQTFGSLFWMAETYFGLAQGMDDDLAKANEYYNKASDQYTKILERDTQQPDFVTDERATGIKLRLVNCKRQQKDFPQAEKYVKEIITAQPKALDAQVEAGLVYQEWAASSTDQFAEHYAMAINGSPKNETPYIWGWANLGNMLQRSIESGTKNKDFEKTYIEARYNSAYCRHQLGLKQSNSAKRNVELDRAKMEIETFAATTAKVDDDAWDRFNSLYKQVLSDMGQMVADLERPKVITPSVAATDDLDKPVKSNGKQPKVPAVKPIPEPAGGSGLLTIILLVVGAVGIAGGAVYFFSKPKKGYTATMAASAPVTIALPPASASPVKRTRSAGTAAAASAKPSAKKPASGAARPTDAPSGKPSAPRPSKPKPPPSA
ncbi:MAG: hypothetical protein O2955_09505 [Planctomycetota bacterium]|nr:hypothetical protein [Planctomycetota bacterium]MDA1212745.1 hypothetical protein [Planctomycetota bacterium]